MKTPKPPYRKPEIKKVRLDVDVLLATNCKTAAGTAKAGRTCHGPGTTCANNAAGS